MSNSKQNFYNIWKKYLLKEKVVVGTELVESEDDDGVMKKVKPSRDVDEREHPLGGQVILTHHPEDGYDVVRTSGASGGIPKLTSKLSNASNDKEARKIFHTYLDDEEDRVEGIDKENRQRGIKEEKVEPSRTVAKREHPLGGIVELTHDEEGYNIVGPTGRSIPPLVGKLAKASTDEAAEDIFHDHMDKEKKRVDEMDRENRQREMKEEREDPSDYMTTKRGSKEDRDLTNAQKAKMKAAKNAPMPKTPMKEHVDALLAGENLSEDFREKAETIFESAVSTRVQEEVSVLEEAYAKSLEEEVSQIHEQLIEQVDSYLNYVVENWVKENEVAIESGLRTELTEGFISGLRNLFAEHYIDVPEEEVNIVEEMGNKLEKIETRLNEEIDRNVSLSRMLNESKQTEILFSAYDGLTTTQAAKLRSLAENITFTTPEEYETKVQTLKESYFSKSVSQRTHLDPVEDADGRTMIAEEHTGPMAHYVKAIGKTIK